MWEQNKAEVDDNFTYYYNGKPYQKETGALSRARSLVGIHLCCLIYFGRVHSLQLRIWVLKRFEKELLINK